MRLPKIQRPESTERLTLTVPQSLHLNLQNYAKFYQSVHNDTVSVTKLSEEMLRSFIAEDKAFREWLKANPSEIVTPKN